MQLDKNKRLLKVSSMSFWKGKKVLVTGGDGFIGSYLVELLLNDSAIVTVASNRKEGLKTNLKALKKDIAFKHTDLTFLDNCRKVCKGQDVVMNLAARVAGIEYNRTHHAEMFQTNMLLQMLPLKAAVECKVKRFLQVSTVCIYPSDAKVPIREAEGERNQPEIENAGYAWAKLTGEKLARFYAESADIEIAIVRPFNAYGRRDYFDENISHVIPALVKRILDGNNPVEVWGSGQQKRAFVHARDIAMGMKLVTEKYAKADPVNIGHNHLVSVKELVKIIQDISGIHNPVVYRTDMPEGSPARSADASKLKIVTGGFVPSTPLEKGIEEIIELYRSNEDAI